MNPFNLIPKQEQNQGITPETNLEKQEIDTKQEKQFLSYKQQKQLKKERIAAQEPYTIILSNCPKQCYKQTIQPIIEKYIKPEQNKIQNIYFRAQSYEKINTKTHKIEYLNEENYTVYEQQLCFIVFTNKVSDEQFNQIPQSFDIKYKEQNTIKVRTIFKNRQLNGQLTKYTFFIPHFTRELSIQKILNFLQKIFDKYQQTCKIEGFRYMQTNNCLYIQYSEQLQQVTADRIYSVPVSIQDKQIKIFKFQNEKKALKAKKVLERRRIAQQKNHKGVNKVGKQVR